MTQNVLSVRRVALPGALARKVQFGQSFARPENIHSARGASGARPGRPAPLQNAFRGSMSDDRRKAQGAAG